VSRQSPRHRRRLGDHRTASTSRHRRAVPQQILAHLGRVAGLCEELGMGDGSTTPLHPNPDMRDLTVVKPSKPCAQWPGCINHALYACRALPETPTVPPDAPRVTPSSQRRRPRRAVDTSMLLASRSSTVAWPPPAAQRLGLPPRLAQLDRTSCHGDGRDNSDEAPAAQVMHLTRGYRRDHRPDLNPGDVGTPVTPGGHPVLMPPLVATADAPAVVSRFQHHPGLRSGR